MILFSRFRGPFLCKVMTFAIFLSCGTHSFLIALLKIFVKESAIIGEATRIIFAGILSIPVALQGFKDKRSLCTLDSDTT